MGVMFEKMERFRYLYTILLSDWDTWCWCSGGGVNDSVAPKDNPQLRSSSTNLSNRYDIFVIFFLPGSTAQSSHDDTAFLMILRSNSQSYTCSFGKCLLDTSITLRRALCTTTKKDPPALASNYHTIQISHPPIPRDSDHIPRYLNAPIFLAISNPWA